MWCFQVSGKSCLLPFKGDLFWSMVLKTICRMLDLILTASIKIEGLVFLSCSLHSNFTLIQLLMLLFSKTEGSINFCVTCGPLYSSTALLLSCILPITPPLVMCSVVYSYLTIISILCFSFWEWSHFLHRYIIIISRCVSEIWKFWRPNWLQAISSVSQLHQRLLLPLYPRYRILFMKGKKRA